MDGLLEIGGVWLARAYAFYGIVFLLIPAFFFADILLLAAVIWAAVSHSRVTTSTQGSSRQSSTSSIETSSRPSAVRSSAW